MGGTLRFLSDVLLGGNRHSKKRKQFSTVELKVRMDCDGCELKVRNTLATMKGAYVTSHQIHAVCRVVSSYMVLD